MRKKSNAQAYLEQVEKYDSIIKNKLIEQQQWRDIALGITANMEGERVKSSGSQNKLGDAVAKCVDMEAEIDSLVDKLVDLKKEVLQVIEGLHSTMQYNVLHLKYIQYKEFWEIADKYGKDYSWATTLHGRALKNVQRILEERKDVQVTN